MSVNKRNSDNSLTPLTGQGVIATQTSAGVVKGGDGTSIGANGEVNVVDRLKEFDTMPTANVSLVSEYVLYTGTTGTYTNGVIYECQENNNTYSWVAIRGYQTQDLSSPITIEGTQETTVEGALNRLNTTFSQALADLKATAIAQAVGATVSDTFSQVITKLSAIVNRGKVTTSIGVGGSYTIPAGYHNGQGKVSQGIADARNSSKVATLTSQDGRRVHSPREIWRVKNSDGTVRTCLELPATGYYENTDIIGATDAQMNNLGWIIPSGTKTITSNGNNQDVKKYASVNVSVPKSAVTYSSTGAAYLSGTKTYNCSVGDMFYIWIDNTGLSGYTGAQQIIKRDSSDAQGVVLRATSTRVTINTGWWGFIIWAHT